MSRNKLVECKYRKEDGTSVCKIMTPYGLACGYSCLHESDIDVESEYVGCAIAHYRAKTDAAHLKSEALRYKYLGVKTAYDLYGDDDVDISKVSTVMRNYRKQYKAARTVYENMLSYDGKFCEKLVNEKRDILDKASRLKSE